MYRPRLKGSHYDVGLKFGRILKKKNTNHFISDKIRKFTEQKVIHQGQDLRKIINPIGYEFNKRALNVILKRFS